MSWNFAIGFTRTRLLHHLEKLYNSWLDRHYKAAPRNGLPIGGGDWMDSFFRCEALRGCIGALQALKPLDEAIEEGKTVSSIAVQIWNKQREWQVHRWEKTAHDFLEQTAVLHWRNLLAIEAKAVRSN